MLGACGLVALEDWKDMLANDHENAKYLAEQLSNINAITVDTTALETNIFRFSLKPDYKKYDHMTLAQHLKEKYSILMNPSFKKEAIRAVTHRDVSRKDMEYVAKSLKECL